MKRWLPGILSCFLPFTVLAQLDSAKTWQVRWVPLNLLDPRTPTLQFGLQKQINNRLAVSVDYGLPINKWTPIEWLANTDRQNFRYHKFRTELKYYTWLKRLPANRKGHPYISGEVFFLPQNYGKLNNSFLRDTIVYHFDSSRVRNHVWGACLKMGREWRFEKWSLDVFGGLGIRNLQIKYRATGLRPTDLELSDIHGDLFPFGVNPDKDLREGWQQYFHLAAGVKLGFFIR